MCFYVANQCFAWIWCRSAMRSIAKCEKKEEKERKKQRKMVVAGKNLLLISIEEKEK
jgi:hypothetical protein